MERGYTPIQIRHIKILISKVIYQKERQMCKSPITSSMAFSFHWKFEFLNDWFDYYYLHR